MSRLGEIWGREEVHHSFFVLENLSALRAEQVGNGPVGAKLFSLTMNAGQATALKKKKKEHVRNTTRSDHRKWVAAPSYAKISKADEVISPIHTSHCTVASPGLEPTTSRGPFKRWILPCGPVTSPVDYCTTPWSIRSFLFKSDGIMVETPRIRCLVETRVLTHAKHLLVWGVNRQNGVFHILVVL
jgi:hypothetical protein